MDEVPEGTIAEVMAWVGEDKDRAAQAMGVEMLDAQGGRKSLINKLEAVLVGEPQDEVIESPVDVVDQDDVESDPQPSTRRVRIVKFGHPYLEKRYD